MENIIKVELWLKCKLSAISKETMVVVKKICTNSLDGFAKNSQFPG